jgi:hypothetical protein
MSLLTHKQRIEQEKELMRQNELKRQEILGARTFSRPHTPSIDHLENRGFHEQTPASAARRAEMQEPARHPVQIPQVREMMSATLLMHQRAKDPITEQAEFLHLLEKKYHAIRGNDKSFEAAINRYHDDMERQRAERSASIARIVQQQQEQFRLKQQEDALLFQQNFQRQRIHQNKQEEESKQGWWRGMFDKAGEDTPEQPHARGGPARSGPARSGPARDEPQPGQRRKMSRAKALEIMGFDPKSTPLYDALKKAFNKQALLLHPDKNLAKPEEAAIKFKRMRKAFNSLIDKGTSDTDTDIDAEGGGIIKRRHKRHKTSKKTRRNSRRKTRRKTHRKSNKRR